MNPSAKQERVSFVLALLFLVLLILSAGVASIYVISDPVIETSLALTRVAFIIDQNYHEDLDWVEMTEAAKQAMFGKLDRYSTYYKQDQFDRLDEELSGSYSGIGVSVLQHELGLMIMSVRENGPADQVGLLSGDIIIDADSVSLAGKTATETTGMLRGEEDTPIRLGIYREVIDEIFEVIIIRQAIPLLHIPFAGYTEDSMLYVRLLDFDPGASADLKMAFDSLLNSGRNPNGIILDLRGNPGGLFSEAFSVADLFLDEGQFIVGTDGRSKWNDHKYYSTGEDITNNLPLALLVDNGSASASEIVAGALQSNDRAILVGDTTFGKGLVQGFVKFPGGEGMKLTISRYYFEGGVYLNDFDSTLVDTGHGLVPDNYFEFESYDSFIRELENSMIMRQFAIEYEDGIIASYYKGMLDESWIARFVGYVAEKDKLIRSRRTNLAADMKELAQDENADLKLSRQLDKFISLSNDDDLKSYFMNKEYILQRLARIAMQRKHGDYTAYRDVLIKERPEIGFAGALLEGIN